MIHSDLMSSGALLMPLAVALVGFCMLWPISLWLRDASLVDIAWGPGFAVQLLVAATLADTTGPRALLLVSLVCLWSLRLGFVLIRRRIREGREDARYTTIRQSWGAGFWWKSLFIVFILQAFLQWLISIGPITGLAASAQSLDSLAWFGALIALGGLILESVADQELDRFKSKSPSGALLTSGLRSYIRHPNYLGEMIFWAGIALICVGGGAWLGLISPVLIAICLLQVSGIPLLDERLEATRPGYTDYRQRVPGLVPRLTSTKPSQ